MKAWCLVMCVLQVSCTRAGNGDPGPRARHTRSATILAHRGGKAWHDFLFPTPLIHVSQHEHCISSLCMLNVVRSAVLTTMQNIGQYILTQTEHTRQASPLMRCGKRRFVYTTYEVPSTLSKSAMQSQAGLAP